MIFLLIRRFKTHSHRPAFQLSAALFASLVLNLVFGIGFYLTERGAAPDLTFLDCLWWAMVTMTTVGYGDYYPVTFAGRFFVAYPCFIIGIGLIGCLLGSTAEIVISSFNKRKKGLGTMKFIDHLIICHCPSVNKVIQVVQEYRANHNGEDLPAVVVSNDLTICPEEFREENIHLIKGASAMEEPLKRAGIASADGIIILAEDPTLPVSDSQVFAAASLATHMRKDLDKKPRIIVEIVDRINIPMMERAGVDGIIPIAGFSERLLVQELVSPGLRKVFDQLVSYHEGAEIYILDHRLTSKTFLEIQIAAIKHPAALMIIGRIRDGKALLPPPKSDTLESTDKLVVLAQNAADFQLFQNSVS